MDTTTNKCTETKSTLILYLYGEAPNESEFEAHLERCEECRMALESHRHVIREYHAEKVAGPRALRAPAAEESWLTKALDFLRAPIERPAFAGAAAFIVMGMFIWAVVHPFGQMKAPAQVANYSDMEARLDTIEGDIGNVFALESASDTETNEEHTMPEHQNISNLNSELEDIRSGITTF